MSVCLGILGVIGIIALITVPLSMLESWQRKRKIEKMFAGRQELSEREFYEKYFEHRGVPFFVVSLIRNALEQELGADMSRLKPEDKFVDLSFQWVDDFDDYTDIPYILEDELKIKIADKELELIETVDELVNLTGQKLQERETNNGTFSH